MRGLSPLGGPDDGFRDDTRGVSPIIGAILLLAIGVILVTVLQTTAIPQLNAQHEFEHNEQAQTELVKVGSAIDRAAVRDAGETLSVPIGIRYPPRILFVNPPPVTGRLTTSDSEQVTIRNAVAAGETGDYWDGSARSFDTRRLVFTPGYNEYDRAPETVIEPWVVYNRIGDQTRPRGGSDLVDGRRISLVTIQGEYQRQETGETALSVQPTSAPLQTVLVGNETEPITLTIPTDLRRDTWEQLLADELDQAGESDDRYVTDISCAQAPPEPCGELTLTLEPGQYELALGAASVGTNAPEEQARYLTTVETADSTIPDTGSQSVTVEVRDRLNAPVPGVEVSFSTSDGSLGAATATTDERGRATVTFSPSTDGPATITAQADLDGDGTITADEEVTIDIDVFSTAGGGGGGTSTVGTGGTERYRTNDTRRTLSTEGGLWRDVTGVSRLLLTNPRFSPTTAGQHEQFEVDQRHFRLVYGIETDTATYYMAVTEPSEGLFYTPSSGAWSNTGVTILKEQSGTTTAVSATLDTAALDGWRDTPGQPLDLLRIQTYATSSSPAFRGRLTEIKQRLRSEQVNLFFADLHGRTDIEPSQTGRSLAYPDAFVDADGNNELQERGSIPPGAPDGDVNNFVRMQQVAGEDEAQLVERNKVEGMSVGTATYGVDQTGTTYTLEIRFRYDKGGGNRAGSSDDVTVRIVDEQGTVLQTAVLNRQNANFREEQITLNDAAREYVQTTGDLYVVYYQNANGVETDLRVDYQRLRVS